MLTERFSLAVHAAVTAGILAAPACGDDGSGGGGEDAADGDSGATTTGNESGDAGPDADGTASGADDGSSTTGADDDGGSTGTTDDSTASSGSTASTTATTGGTTGASTTATTATTGDPSTGSTTSSTTATTGDPSTGSTTSAGTTGDPSTTGAGTGTTGGLDTDPPRLIKAEFLDSFTTKLTFSEPMADVSGVNPAVFRISFGSYWSSYGGFTLYYDVNAYTYYNVDNNIGLFDVSAVQNDPQDETALLLTMANSVQEGCWAFQQYYEANAGNGLVEAGTFVHFNQTEVPTPWVVEDLASNALEDFGHSFTYYGHPNYNTNTAGWALAYYSINPFPEDAFEYDWPTIYACLPP